MAENSKIEWCDDTFNGWIGCTEVGPGCANCYAKADFDLRKHRVKWGAGNPRSRTSAANWRKPLQWNAQPFAECGACGWRGEKRHAHLGGWHCPVCRAQAMKPARRRVFCASLADVFDNEVPAAWRADLFDLIARTPNLDWLLLTKRIGNVGRMVEAATCMTTLPGNVWLGITVVNQAEADRDIPKLLATPAAVRFLSMEPLLEAVDLWGYLPNPFSGCPRASARSGPFCDEPAVGWVVVGGESGPGARPMHPQWARDIRDQCEAAGVPFLFKQWGEWSPRAKICGAGEDFQTLDPQCKRWPDVIRLGEHGLDTRVTENCTDVAGQEVYVQRVGKKAAGRLLDGREHNGFPGGAR